VSDSRFLEGKLNPLSHVNIFFYPIFLDKKKVTLERFHAFPFRPSGKSKNANKNEYLALVASTKANLN